SVEQTIGNRRLKRRRAIENLRDSATANVEQGSTQRTVLGNKRRTHHGAKRHAGKMDIADRRSNGASIEAAAFVQSTINRVQVNYRLAQGIARIGEVGQIDKVVTTRAVEVGGRTTHRDTCACLALGHRAGYLDQTLPFC